MPKRLLTRAQDYLFTEAFGVNPADARDEIEGR
jgi:hypothetical protein